MRTTSSMLAAGGRDELIQALAQLLLEAFEARQLDPFLEVAAIRGFDHALLAGNYRRRRSTMLRVANSMLVSSPRLVTTSRLRSPAATVCRTCAAYDGSPPSCFRMARVTKNPTTHASSAGERTPARS